MERRAGDVGDISREVADRPIRIEQAGTFASHLAIAQQFHLNLSPSCGLWPFANSPPRRSPSRKWANNSLTLQTKNSESPPTRLKGPLSSDRRIREEFIVRGSPRPIPLELHPQAIAARFSIYQR